MPDPVLNVAATTAASTERQDDVLVGTAENGFLTGPSNKLQCTPLSPYANTAVQTFNAAVLGTATLGDVLAQRLHRYAGEHERVQRLVDALLAASSALYGGTTARNALKKVLNTIEGEPDAYIDGLVGGFAAAIIAALKSMATLVTDAGAFVLRAGACLEAEFDQAMDDFLYWTADISKAYPQGPKPMVCQPLYDGISKTIEFAKTIDSVGDRYANASPGQVIDIAIEQTTVFLEWVAKLDLWKELADASGDPRQLGALHGSTLGTMVTVLIPPDELLPLTGEGWAKLVELAAKRLENVANESQAARVVGLVVGIESEASVLQEAQAAGSVATRYLRKGKAFDFTTGKLSGANVVAFAELMRTPEFSSALSLIYENLTRILETLPEAVLPHIEMRKKLAAVNAMEKFMIMTEETAKAGPGVAGEIGKSAEQVVPIVQARAEEELYESAHLFDGRLVSPSSPAQLRAELAALGLEEYNRMPAFPAPRAVHRTTLRRLAKLGMDVPQMDEYETITNTMMAKVVFAPAKAGADVLVVDAQTHAYQVIRKHGEVYSELLRRTWTGRRQAEVFKYYEAAIKLVAGSDEALLKQLTNEWAEFAKWKGG